MESKNFQINFVACILFLIELVFHFLMGVSGLILTTSSVSLEYYDMGASEPWLISGKLVTH